jgi:hypothetical protein
MTLDDAILWTTMIIKQEKEIRKQWGNRHLTTSAQSMLGIYEETHVLFLAE